MEVIISRLKGEKIYRLVFFLLIIGMISFSLITYFTFNKKFNEYVLKSKTEHLITIGKLIAEQIDGDVYENPAIKLGKDGDKNIDGKLKNLLISYRQKFPEISQIYILVPTDRANTWQFAVNISYTGKANKNEIRLPQSKIRQAYSGEVVSAYFTVNDNKMISSCIPILSSKGKVTAVLGLHMNVADTVNFDGRSLKYNLIILLILPVIIVTLCFVMVYSLLKPIRVMTNRLTEIEKDYSSIHLPEGAAADLGLTPNNFNRFLDTNHALKQRMELLSNEVLDEKDKMFRVYRDVIRAITQEKVYLTSPAEFSQIIQQEVPVLNFKLNSPHDITRCRMEIDQYLTKVCSSWQSPRRHKALLCLSEAMTNVIKHAGSGEVLLALNDNRIVFYVLDQGPGMELAKLPFMVFLKGFSTKTSMGFGFSIMFRYLDKLILSTSESGTRLALEISLSKSKC
ncbi:ATP-binding protein [Desulfotomaculum nigrificans]|uniref:ATP-binding protein n=1 Tax=Desulfotomaculum nigrificans TaxID=1565 RepID=UPI0001FADE55|nr:ATP-binding protein [Desulfotomaculum nigrificans]